MVELDPLVKSLLALQVPKVGHVACFVFFFVEAVCVSGSREMPLSAQTMILVVVLVHFSTNMGKLSEAGPPPFFFPLFHVLFFSYMSVLEGNLSE